MAYRHPLAFAIVRRSAWSIPRFRAKIPHFTSKIVEHSRHLLLGYQFSPRLAELKEARFWRMDPNAEYGPLNGLARHRINTNLIATNWDDILRVAGSLKVGTIHASTLVQALQRGGHPMTLGRAIAELGRIPKTLHFTQLY